MFTPSLMGQVLYNFGNPTGDEQLYIELINRARANPSAEGARFAATTDPVILSAYSQFGVDLTMMQTEFNAIAVQPPLAPNASLTTAARGHSAWMLANATQSHNETNPSNTTVSRVTDAGYNFSFVGENVYAYYNLVFQGHAGFQVDWGSDEGGEIGGMQSNRGHRVNIHKADYREIGVGVVSGSNGAVGPNLVTQDFGARAGATSFGTGVAYYDLNGNDFYDSGEGISGLRVDVAGSSNFCTTAIGGGWAVPVPNLATTRAITFSGLGVNQTTNLVFPASNNAKLDLKLTYTPPTITSSANASEGVSHLIEFEQTPGASGYQWSRWSMAAASTENCETTNDITTVISEDYAVLNTAVKQQGTASFHLVNATSDEQSLELETLYYGKPTSSLTFQSQIRFATTSETFKVQVKEESNTAEWQDVFSQIGTDGSGEASFQTRIVDLSSMNGKAFRIRFFIDPGNTFFPFTGDTFGWFIDAISFSNIDALSNQTTELLADTNGSFTPSIGTLLMVVAPRISNIEYPASYQILTTTAQQLQVEQPVNTVLTDGATTLTFGSSEVGIPVIKTVTIRNTDSDELSGIAVDLSGSHTSDFVVSALGATTLAVGDTTTFNVTFTPTALGSRSAALEITSNETIETPFNLSLSGEGDTDDPVAFTFVGTPYELRVGNTVSFDLKRLISDGQTIKLSGKVPSGLKYNSTTGLLSGKLGKLGVYQLSVQLRQGKTLVRTIALPITVLAFPTSLIGNFDCILEDGGSIPTGAFRLSIKAANQWTATLDAVGASKTRKAKGTFVLGEGTPTAPITAIFPADSGAPAVTVNITLDGSTANQTGTYGGGTLRGFRVARTADNPPATVICNLVLDAGVQDGLTVPAGLGWMKGKVSTKGIGTFKGLLGDGTAASFTLPVSACGQAVLWSQPYSNRNSFIGGIVTLGDLDQPATSDLPLDNVGAWWVKAADMKTLSYPSGFPIMPVTIGTSRWTVPATAAALGASLGWNENRKTAVTIDGGGLSNEEPQATIASLPTEFSIDDKFILTTSEPDAVPLVAWKGNVSKADGGIVGTLTIPTGFSPDVLAGAAAASGVLVQDESWGTVTGCGLVKVPISGVKGSFKTAALILEQ